MDRLLYLYILLLSFTNVLLFYLFLSIWWIAVLGFYVVCISLDCNAWITAYWIWGACTSLHPFARPHLSLRKQSINRLHARNSFTACYEWTFGQNTVFPFVLTLRCSKARTLLWLTRAEDRRMQLFQHS